MLTFDPTTIPTTLTHAFALACCLLAGVGLAAIVWDWLVDP